MSALDDSGARKFLHDLEIQHDLDDLTERLAGKTILKLVPAGPNGLRVEFTDGTGITLKKEESG